MKTMQKSDMVLESRSYKLFTRSIDSHFTLKTYVKGLNRFSEFTSLSYDEIVKLDTEDLQIKLEDWIGEMIDSGLRQHSILTFLSGVEKFLDMNRRTYFKKVLHATIRKDKDLGGGSMPYENIDIQKMLIATNKKRDIVLIHFFASTGTRPQALEDPVLKMKHLIEIEDCYAIRIYDNSKEGYWCFLTPEARITLDDYIKSRKLNNERISEESPIFASIEKTATYPHLTVNSAYQILFKLLKNSGISREKVGNRFNKAMVYGFRKRFNTILKNNNLVNSNIAEKLMAHKNGLDGVYYVPTREECFAEFKKAIPSLTIDNSERLRLENEVKTKTIQKIESEKDVLIKQLQEQMKENENTKSDVKKILKHLKL